MKYLSTLLLVILSFSSCKKASETEATKIDIAAVNRQLKGTWITSSTTTYYSASSADTYLTPELPLYNFSFDGQTALTLIGKVASIPNVITKYNLTSDDKSAYFNYNDELTVAHTMQITNLAATELDFNETTTYTQPLVLPRLFAYNKKVTSYKCSKN